MNDTIGAGHLHRRQGKQLQFTIQAKCEEVFLSGDSEKVKGAVNSTRFFG